MNRGRILPTAAALLLAGHLAAGAVQVVPATAERWVAAARDAGLDADEARAKAFGLGWVAAVESIRARVPADGAYLLVRGAGAPEGAEHWPRYELAPRRAHYLGAAEGLPPAARLHALPGDVRWVVVACDPYRPPRLLARWRFLADLEAGRLPGCP